MPAPRQTRQFIDLMCDITNSYGMTSLDIDLLRTFVTVVETHSFTRAAQQRGLTQPAVSLQMRRLEQQLGAPLLDRGGARGGLTTEGEIGRAHV